MLAKVIVPFPEISRDDGGRSKDRIGSIVMLGRCVRRYAATLGTGMRQSVLSSMRRAVDNPLTSSSFAAITAAGVVVIHPPGRLESEMAV